jgi:hypothetical protein
MRFVDNESTIVTFYGMFSNRSNAAGISKVLFSGFWESLVSRSHDLLRIQGPLSLEHTENNLTAVRLSRPNQIVEMEFHMS